jgi:hypothetical protein
MLSYQHHKGNKKTPYTAAAIRSCLVAPDNKWHPMNTQRIPNSKPPARTDAGMLLVCGHRLYSTADSTRLVSMHMIPGLRVPHAVELSFHECTQRSLAGIATQNYSNPPMCLYIAPEVCKACNNTRQRVSRCQHTLCWVCHGFSVQISINAGHAA